VYWTTDRFDSDFFKRLECSRKPRPQAARTSARDTQSYDGLRVRFSATLGEELNIEMTLLVRLPD